MGFKLKIGNSVVEASEYSVTESSSSLAAGDSSGAVGTLSFSVPQPDPDIFPNHPLIKYGTNLLIDREVRLDDARKGFTLGKVASVSNAGNSALISVQGLSRMGDLVVYNVQSAPFVGTLSNAFHGYLALAGVTTGIFVAPEIATRQVVFPGFSGDLWFNLKQMATAVNCDIALVSGIIVLRPLRTRTLVQGRDLERQTTIGGGSKARFVEVFQYNNTPITNKLVYPIGGWSEDVSTINVNAGETVEEVLELSASMSSITQPVMQTFVSRTHDTSSVYTVVGDDGLPITPAAWSGAGGSLSVKINDDTTSLTVTITAPTDLPSKEGKPIGVFGISLSADNSTGRYSTLRIVGSGVAFNKQSTRIPTGVSEAETATEVGVTVDNPFFSTFNEVAAAGIWAARGFNGTGMTLSGQVTAVNRLGETGGLKLRDYAYVQALHSGKTYAQVQTLWGGRTYAAIEEELNQGLDSDFENQAFGNVAGGRIWDRQTARWYRVRSASHSPGSISFEGEDDLLHSDVSTYWAGKTYANVQTALEGFTYREVDLMGLRGGSDPANPVLGLYPSETMFPSGGLFPVGA